MSDANLISDEAGSLAANTLKHSEQLSLLDFRTNENE